jgi:argonaute-like protein implicated in RNA metabolism and viral defense
MQSSPDSDLVLGVRVVPNKPPYHYAIGALGLIVTMGDLNAMGVNPSDVQKHLRLSPVERNAYTTHISQELQRFTQRSPGVQIGTAFTGNSHPHLFWNADQIGFTTNLRFGRNAVTQINSDGEMLQALKKYGIYRLGDDFTKDGTIRIAVLDALPDSEGKETLYQGLHEKLKQTLRPIGLVPPASLKYKKLSLDQSPTELRAQLDRLLKVLIASNPHIILIYLPKTDRKADDDASSLYHRAKSICVREGVPSQVVYEDTLSKGYATANIVMGILGKTGNTPFVLGDPIDYADVVVGLDVSRRLKTRAAGTTSIAAMSRIYLNTGEFIGYSFSSAPIEGETIPTHVLETIFPESEFGGKRVVIHRDGNFRGEELNNLTAWGESIGAVFLPMEVTKSGAARLYGAVDESIYQAEKGSAFVIDERTAYLVSSPPPFDNATAMPLTIKNFSGLTLQQALHSVLALTLLHYGSVRPPKLPVSTHFSDEIAGLLTRGIYPLQERGKKPYWL